MKSKWFVAALIFALLTVVMVVSAVITATGAFGSDPGERVNRADFAWAVLWFGLMTFCFYRSGQHKA